MFPEKCRSTVHALLREKSRFATIFPIKKFSNILALTPRPHVSMGVRTKVFTLKEIKL